ncbi:GntR family transcriptional regulator [Pseudomonas savastanoi pv. nerii]|nr:GntR family transcriptional regulator [Pseudomonas savastanoi pv. nerii]
MQALFAPMPSMKRYEKFAADISEMIRSGVLPAGEKVPSVRVASRTYSVSPATVFKAYYLLEDKGLIQARARSGYYVREHAANALTEPELVRHTSEGTELGVSDLIFSVLGSLKNPDTVPFGSAFPSPNLYPLPRLAKSMSSAVRAMTPAGIVSDMTTGNSELRRQIALRYMISGVRLPADELVITNGAMEGLNLCLQCVTEPGDLVAIEAPAFYACLQVLERLKLKAVEIPVHPRDGVDLDSLQDSLTRLPIKACWFMSSFQNPLGASMTQAKKNKALQPAGTTADPADRGRCVRRAVLRRQCTPSGQKPGSQRAGDALQLVFQDPGPRLPCRLGGRRALYRTDQSAETDDHHFTLCPRPGSDCRLPQTWRLRPAPAQIARHPRTATGRDAGRCRSLFPGSDTRHPPRWRVLSVVRIPRASGLAAGVPDGPGPRHQPGTRPDLLGLAALQELRTPELRHALG